MKQAAARWELVAFCLLVAVTQVGWLTFAPLLSVVQARYAIGETTASALLLVFPLLYVLLSVHAGSSLDRLGYQRVVGRAAVATAVFATARVFGESFGVLLVAQTGLAAAQPYVINAIPKLVAESWDDRRATVVTGSTQPRPASPAQR